MQTINDGFRYELKIPFENTAVFQIRRYVNLHPMLFRVMYPPRQVNNIYFDTQDYDLLQDHIDGSHIRQKLRLRWYGSRFEFNSSQLEIKRKTGNLGKKEIQLINHKIDLRENSYEEINQFLRIHSSPIFTELLVRSNPILINNYQREYFESADGLIRLTIDYQLQSFDQRFSNLPNINFPEPFHNIPIIEIKSYAKNHKLISKAISGFPLRSEQFSKYLDGMLPALNR